MNQLGYMMDTKSGCHEMDKMGWNFFINLDGLNWQEYKVEGPETSKTGDSPNSNRTLNTQSLSLYIRDSSRTLSACGAVNRFLLSPAHSRCRDSVYLATPRSLLRPPAPLYPRHFFFSLSPSLSSAYPQIKKNTKKICFLSYDRSIARIPFLLF